MEDFLLTYARELIIAIAFVISGLALLFLSKLQKKSPYNWKAVAFFMFLLLALIFSTFYGWQLNIVGECSELPYLKYLQCKI
jgi:hypothetical protein